MLTVLTVLIFSILQNVIVVRCFSADVRVNRNLLLTAGKHTALLEEAKQAGNSRPAVVCYIQVTAAAENRT